jgi:hypothetical protein
VAYSGLSEVAESLESSSDFVLACLAAAFFAAAFAALSESSESSESSEDFAFFDEDAELDESSESSDPAFAFFAAALVEGLLLAGASSEVPESVLLESVLPESVFAEVEPLSEPDESELDDRCVFVAALPSGFFFAADESAVDLSAELSPESSAVLDESSDVLVAFTVGLDDESVRLDDESSEVTASEELVVFAVRPDESSEVASSDVVVRLDEVSADFA